MGPHGNSWPCVLAFAFCVLIHHYQLAEAYFSKGFFPTQKIRMVLDSTGGSQLTANTTAFSSNFQVVAVNVQRPAKLANSHDIVALYTHPTDPRSTVPLTWLNITATNPNYQSSGRGTVIFKLLNFRQNVIFRLLENGTFSPAVLAESVVIRNTIPDSPGQVHLALHADGKSMVVQWVSGSSSPQQLQYSTAKAGLTLLESSKDSKPAVVASTSRTYTADMMCGEPATTFGFISPGYMHTAVIPGDAIPYSKQVQYRVGSPDVGFSDVFTFTSQPDPGAVAKGEESFTFLVFNDVGQENAVVFWDLCPPYCPGGWQWVNYTANSTKLVKHLQAERHARLALLIGDLSYANGVQADWDYFGHQFQPAFSRWPLAVATGNHERDMPGTADITCNASSESGGECNVPYTYRYYTPAWEAAGQYDHKAAPASRTTAVPKSTGSKTIFIDADAASRSTAGISSITSNSATAPGGNILPPAAAASLQHNRNPVQPDGLPQWLNPDKSYYAFNMGGVHFLMLDSESPSNPGSPQHSFVVDDLAKVDRRRHPWVVASLHRQMNGPTTDAVNVEHMLRLQADYEELFYKHRVDVVLQGHDHAYARTCPIYKGKCISAGSRRFRSDNGSRGGGSKAAASSSSSNSSRALQVYDSPAAPIYILAGHAGAGFTHAFPNPLPEWVEYGVQDQNGYVRVVVRGDSLTLESVSTDDGHVIDAVKIIKGSWGNTGRYAAHSAQKSVHGSRLGLFA